MLPLFLCPEAYCVHPSETCILLYTGALLKAFLLTLTTLFPNSLSLPMTPAFTAYYVVIKKKICFQLITCHCQLASILFDISGPNM